MAIKTVNFLPQIFKTDTNRKFLNATLDQLVSEPDLRRVNGYVGRTFAPTFKSSDNYQPEINSDRQNYQLEPSVVIKDKNKKTLFFSSYIDLLQQIKHYGGLTDNHSRLFSNQTYSFDGRVDFDKLVNFNQYYWLENGPDAVDVYSDSVDQVKTFKVIRDSATNSYKFEGYGFVENPEIRLAYGGVYKFEVNQPGYPFYIQSDPGTVGFRVGQQNVSTREVSGVTNNGAEVGVITFNVPSSNSQDFYLQMPISATVDFSTELHYRDVQYMPYAEFIAKFQGFDGPATNLQSKTLIFVNDDLDDLQWTGPEQYDTRDKFIITNANNNNVTYSESYSEGVSAAVTYAVSKGSTVLQVDTTVLAVGMYVSKETELNSNLRISSIVGNQVILNAPLNVDLQAGDRLVFHYTNYDTSLTIPADKRRNVWKINVRENLVDPDTADKKPITSYIELEPYTDVPQNSRVYVIGGKDRGKLTYYRDSITDTFKLMPPITAPLPVLYYQDGVSEQFQGQFILSEVTGGTLDVNNILGQTTYRSPNGIEFTNGLKVRFRSSVTPAAYGEKEYYVEGVGTSIKLLDVDSFISPEGFGAEPDYITINRASRDLNPWTRSNRWFHADILELTAKANNTINRLDQRLRANRPIIEFDADLQLYKFGKQAKKPIDILLMCKNSFTDAFNDLELQEVLTLPQGVKLVDGQRIVFGNDVDDKVKNKIYTVKYFYTQGKFKVSLQLTDDYEILPGNNFIAKSGIITDYFPVWSNNIDYYAGEKVCFSSGTFNVYLATENITRNDEDPKNNIKWTALYDVWSAKTNYYTGNKVVYGTASASNVYQANTDITATTTTPNLDPNWTNLGTPNTGEVTVGVEYYYDGENWIRCQDKTGLNQQPLFDSFDLAGISLSDTDKYPVTGVSASKKFAGTKIFSYGVGAGSNDAILGFPLSYRNFNQIGDIQFVNDFEKDSFSYYDSESQSIVSKKINTIATLKINHDLDSYKLVNMWLKEIEPSQQFQIISYNYDGLNQYFQIDILGENNDSTIPHFRVFKNSKKLSSDFYEIVKLGVSTYVKINDPELVKNDRIDIKIFSNSVSALGYYEIPKNLEYNTTNKLFTSLTLGQLRYHLETAANNSNRLIGNVPGASNARDIQLKRQGGSIVQHASPVLYSELFLVDQSVNFMNAIDLARHEYSKIKNKYLELSQSLVEINQNDIPYTCDLILKNINQVKNKSFPWYYSDMVPYGDIKNVISRSILDAQIRDYQISQIFEDKKLSNKALLVYLNNVQLIKDLDYTIDQTRAGITIASSVKLTVGDNLKIVEYSDTDGNYIPETPTKLGLYPKFRPAKFLDDTYATPIYVIRGHDGSITPAFNDFRDDLLLEFEKRIFNNIKVDYDANEPDLHNFVPGKFRETAYNLNEFNQLLTRSFLKWCGGNRIDFTTNSYFVSSNPFTWNYRRFQDTIDQSQLPGTWRAIFNYFYDTDSPHISPWEMLGFSIKPDWWETRYGPAPYTGGNMVLWQDLEEGYIHAGPRKGFDSRFARPGLTSIIPVDDRGSLRPPNEFAVLSINSNDTNLSYAVGDQGPVETAWRRSSDFPFAVQQALAIGYPAYYFGTLINVGNYSFNSQLNQFVLTENLQRITPTAILYNGDVLNGNIVRAAGYLNYVQDYLRSNGIEPISKLKEYFKFISVNLAYKMAGFSDTTMLQVIAEQSSPTSVNQGVVIPQENYSLELFKSTPTETIVYSAVIIEKSENGYTVSGYDLSNPYFTIIPSVATNNAYAITVANDRAVIYDDYQNYKINIPYGYEFLNKQQVVDFLVSYQRYLVGIGLIFGSFDTDLTEKRDFILSCKEFLNWSQQGWQAGSVLVLSPIYNSIEILTERGTIDSVENSLSNSKILDTNFNYIKSSQFSVLREDNSFKLTSNYSQTIALAVLNVVEYEHIVIFDNETVFSDIIYKPELGNRQYRLKLVGAKTGNWNGILSPGGFINNEQNIAEWLPGTDYKKGSLVLYKSFYYAALDNIIASNSFNLNQWRLVPKSQIKIGLLPNFTYNAGKFNDFFDLENPSSESYFDDYSNRLIGFQERQYLTDFGINKTVQAKFYQGFIKEKGTLNAVTAFTAAGFNNVSSQINLYEEWGIRIGEYGALDNNKFVEVQLIEGKFTGDPVTFTLLPEFGTSDDKIIGIKQHELYKTGVDYQANVYLNRTSQSIYENDIHTAGYVNINDVDATIFDLSNYSTLTTKLPEMGIGYKLWCAKDFVGDWNVFRLTETESSVIEVSYNVDNICTVSTQRATDLAYGDLIVIKGFDERLDGIFQVYNVISPLKFSIVAVQIADQIKQIQSITGRGPLYKFVSVRIKESSDLNAITPIRGWQNNDKLWVDNDQNTNSWAVYNKTVPWSGNVSDFNANMKMIANSYVIDSGFGSITALNQSGNLAAAGMPTASSVGRVIVFSANASNGYTFTNVANITTTSTGVSKFGYSLDIIGNVVFVGSPGNGSSESGNVYIYDYNHINGQTSLKQQISSNWTPNVGDLFGESISVSQDARWLFIGAPNKGNLEVFCTNATGYYLHANTISSSATYKFGKKVKTTSDGSQTIISAPYETINSVSSAGAVYVYDRSIETFIARETDGYETLNYMNQDTVRVLVDGNVQLKNQDYTVAGNLKAIIFAETPLIGSRIDIETNKFELLQKLTATNISSGAEFGISAHISGNDADIYVASPGYSETGYHSGIVYRFVDRGAAYGEIVGKNVGASVTVGHSIRINGQLVTFTHTDLEHVAININNANIAGVSATTSDFGRLTISSNITVPYEKLLITPGVGTALTDIGLSVYDFAQELRHPTGYRVDQFGSQVISTPDSSQLVVSASAGTTYNNLTLDAQNTTFDDDSTNFLDAIPGSGAVFIYGLVGGHLAGDVEDQYVLVQNLENKNLKPNDSFGTGLAMNANILLVGAQNDSGNKIIPDSESGLLTEVPRTGTYYIYTNYKKSIGWDIVATETPKVDINSISSAYIYNLQNQQILERLDFIDPAKGRILGTAAQDIDFRTPYDPAIYNVAGTTDEFNITLSVSSDYHWGASQVGKIWWNLDTVRFLDYEQGSLIYRSANWGALFPGSSVEVYEWVESTVMPNQYTGPGTPKYPDNSAFVIDTYVDEVSKIVRSRYYFWVRNKTTININSPKTSSAATIEQLIANPSAQNIPYFEVLRTDTISLHGITDRISANNTILHLNYDTLKNTNLIHSEYTLVQEGSNNSFIPENIIEKLKDSLSGVDRAGQSVPDPNLAIQNRLGIKIRPRQSMFVDRLLAVKNFINYVNSVLMTTPVCEEFNLDKLYSGEPLPDIEQYDRKIDTRTELDYIKTDNLWYNYTVLVVNDESNSNLWSLYSYANNAWQLSKVQSYYVPFYWEKTDWYDNSYDYTMAPDYVVDTLNDLQRFKILPNNTEIKVLNNGRGQFEIYRYIDNQRSLVGIQNGTIQFNSKLYTSGINSSVEFRIIFDTILFELFTKSLSDNFNKLFFFVINYILTEQKNVDWIFKTSFVSVVHKLKKLLQFSNYIKDNQTYYESYINEIKPYRTSLREYVLDYEGNDQFEGDITDFDLPSMYVTELDNYHSPDGSTILDAALLSSKDQYSQWRNNHSYSIGQVLVSNPGKGIQDNVVTLFLKNNLLVEKGDIISQTQTGGTISGTVSDDSSGNVVTLVTVTEGLTFNYVNYIYKNAANTHILMNSFTVLSNSGYYAEPQVTVTGGGGSGANIRAIIDYDTNTIAEFQVINPGSGYTSTPTIQINGVGVGAAGYPILTGQYYDEKIVAYDLTLEKPVTVYAGNLILQPNTDASGTVYFDSTDNTITLVDVVGTFASNDYVFTESANLSLRAAAPTNILILSGNANLYTGNVITNTNAKATVFKPASGKKSSEYNTWITEVLVWNVQGTFTSSENALRDGTNLGVQVIHNKPTGITSPIAQYYTSVNKNYNKVRTFNERIKFDRISYDTSVIDWQPNITVPINTVVSYQGRGYKASETVYSSAVLKLTSNISVSAGNYVGQIGQTGNAKVSVASTGNVITVANLSGQFLARAGNIIIDGVTSSVKPLRITNVFDRTKYSLVKSEEFTNANDRIWAHYQPTPEKLPKDLGKLISGIEYPGVKVSGVTFAETSRINSTNVISTGSFISSTGAQFPDVNLLQSQDLTKLNFVDLGYAASQPLTLIYDDQEIITLSGSVYGKPGDHLVQGSNSAIIYENISGNVLAVRSNVLSISGGTIDVIAHHEYQGNINLSAAITAYTGQVFIQPDTSATAVVAMNTYNSSTISVVSINGSFRANSYMYLDAANTNAYYNSVNYSEYTITTPYTVIKKQKKQADLTIQGVESANLYVTGQKDIISSGANLTLKYYDFNDPAYLDTIISSEYGFKTYQITLQNILSAPAGSEIGQINNEVYAVLKKTLVQSDKFLLSNIKGLFDTMSNITVNGIDSGIKPSNVQLITDTQSSLGVKTEDINVVGGAYRDTFSSHAPEELIPGRVFDSLILNVYTKIYNGSANVGYRIIQGMNANVNNTNSRYWPNYARISNITAKLAANLLITDSNIYVDNASILAEPNSERGIPGTVYINGELITYFERDLVNNRLGRIRRAVNGTGAPGLHSNLSIVQNASKVQEIPYNSHTKTWLDLSVSAVTISLTAANNTIYTGNTVTQYVTGATGTVYTDPASNVLILTANVGTFDTTNYLYKNGVSNLRIKPTATIGSSLGLQGSGSDAALFIKGNI